MENKLAAKGKSKNSRASKPSRSLNPSKEKKTPKPNGMICLL